MPNKNLPQEVQGAQRVVRHNAPTDEHFWSWVRWTRQNLYFVREERKLPQTKEDHATLAEREARYVGYLKRAGVLS